jgi:UDP:flavonoid glycosyltransferase YjiC (YdhE family)
VVVGPDGTRGLWAPLPDSRGADQFLNAETLPTGAALRLVPEQIEPEAVARATASLLSEPTFRDAAQAIDAEIAAMPAPAEVVGELERLR